MSASYNDPDNTLLKKILEGVQAAGSGISPAVQSALDAKQDDLGYTPEDSANKDTDGTFAANSDVKYPSQKAAKTYVDAGDGSTLSQAQAYTDELTINHSTLTQASPTVIDFTGDPYKSLTLSGAVTFESTNRSAARSVTVRIIAGGSSRNLTFHADWIFIGAAAPASLAANKEAILTLTCFGTTEALVRVAYAAQP